MERTKVAIIREPGHPVGEPAPCYLNCPCGAKPPAPADAGLMTWCACGAIYDAAGWLVRRSSAWEAARQLGRRAFYERATETLRTCPENYCLAARQEVRGRYVWRPFVDAALREHETTIVAEIERWAAGSTGDALAEAVGAILPPWKGGEAR